MKITICILTLFLNLISYSQTTNPPKDIRIELFTSEKNTKNIVVGAIIEVFSNNKRIKTDFSDFDGISIFYLKSNEIADNKIVLKIHAPKCSTFEKVYHIKSDQKINIDLSYGDTKYQSHKDFLSMLAELNIKIDDTID